MVSQKQRKDNKPEALKNPLIAAYNELLKDRAEQISKMKSVTNKHVSVVCHDHVAEHGTHGYVRKEKIVFFEPGLFDESDDALDKNVNKFVVRFLKTLATRNALYASEEPKMYSEKGFKILDHEYRNKAWVRYDEICNEVSDKLTASPGFKQWMQFAGGYVTEDEYQTSPNYKEKREKQENVQKKIFGGVPHVFVGVPDGALLAAQSATWDKARKDMIHRKISADAVANKYERLYQLGADMYVLASYDIAVEQRDNIEAEISELAADRDLAQEIKEEILIVRHATFLTEEYKHYVEERNKQKLSVTPSHGNAMAVQQDKRDSDIVADFSDNLELCRIEAQRQNMDMVELNRQINEARSDGELGPYVIDLINTLYPDDGSDKISFNMPHFN